MAKRKFARIGEKTTSFQCTKRKCKWEGTDEQKGRKGINEYQTEHVCPKCGNNEFYGLL